MNSLILGLPVDGRPVVREQVMHLVASAQWTLQLPEVAQLGHFRQAADRDALAQWLLQAAPQADGLVLSIDMLVYGGLVPSRFIDDTQDALVARLELLRTLKAAAPQRLLYAFAATMRISNNDVAEEEKTYWADYGRRLWAWSYHTDRFNQLQDGADQQAAAAAAQAIPQAIRDDYRATRARNHHINRLLLQYVQEGVIDRLVLPQDDTAEYGFNIAERRALQAAVIVMGLAQKVLVYPGADEVLHTLCALMVSTLRGDAPLRLCVRASDPRHLLALRPLYEDRPAMETLGLQFQAVNAVLVDTPEEADVLLAVYCQGAHQGDWAMQKPLPQPTGLSETWLQSLQTLADNGRAVAVLDLAYANGGDPLLLAGLKSHVLLGRIAAYGGWNTSSNRMGSLLAQLVLARHDLGSAANGRNTCLRLLEDVLYQAIGRQTFRISVPEARLTPAQLQTQIDALVRPMMNDWLQANGFAWRVRSTGQPWQRSFEIDLQLQSVAQGAGA